ncbi:hypothetical protein M6B38_331105 [Iris pallida]|uniref:Uncharacterized protein n=1 Tax=Iris pallida TaxID=29817 RepID=A0AAX6H3J2_IRIPA|nr:hypothetical protein M6B38_331105 [Iris pallida]
MAIPTCSSSSTLVLDSEFNSSPRERSIENFKLSGTSDRSRTRGDGVRSLRAESLSQN